MLLCLLCGCASRSENAPVTQPQDPGAMTDEDLIIHISERLWSLVFSDADPAVGFAGLTENQKVVFALNYLDMEVANGGLCQFFANDRGLVAPYIGEYLKLVGAEEHQALFDGFLAKYGIDANDLSEFSFTTIEEFVELYDLYPFDEFDDPYYQLPPLSSYLAPLVRENLDEFM
jgi:hypothetical protein